MTKPAINYAKYRSPEEIRRDEELEKHDSGECEGMPYCAYCQEDWEEANREELEAMGYYDSKGHWTK